MAALEATRYGTTHRLSAGLEVNGYRFAHDVFRGSEGDIARLLPHIEREDRTASAALHVTDEWRPSSQFSTRLGMRVLAVQDGGTLLLPRFGARLGLSPQLALTAGLCRDNAGDAVLDALLAAPPGRPVDGLCR